MILKNSWELKILSVTNSMIPTLYHWQQR